MTYEVVAVRPNEGRWGYGVTVDLVVGTCPVCGIVYGIPKVRLLRSLATFLWCIAQVVEKAERALGQVANDMAERRRKADHFGSSGEAS